MFHVILSSSVLKNLTKNDCYQQFERERGDLMSEMEKIPPKRRGRPPKALSDTKVKPEFSELAKTKSVAALKRLMAITKDKDAKPEVVVKACETVIAYGYGKPGAGTGAGAESVNSDVKVEVDYE